MHTHAYIVQRFLSDYSDVDAIFLLEGAILCAGFNLTPTVLAT